MLLFTVISIIVLSLGFLALDLLNNESYSKEIDNYCELECK